MLILSLTPLNRLLCLGLRSFLRLLIAMKLRLLAGTVDPLEKLVLQCRCGEASRS